MGLHSAHLQAIVGKRHGAGTVTSVTVNVGDTTLQVNWPIPAANGAAIDQYRLTPIQAGTPGTPLLIGTLGVTSPAPSPGGTLTGLTDGLPYNMKVEAHNSVGWGGAFTTTATYTPVPTVVPTQPVQIVNLPVPPGAPAISQRWAALLMGLGN